MVICNIISYRNKHLLILTSYNKVTYQLCYYDPDGGSRWLILLSVLFG